MTIHAPARAAALLLLAGAAACGTARSAPAAAPHPVRSTAPAAGADHRYTAADVRFMSGMIGHHAQAIVMSNWAPTHGASESLRILAERIINAQRGEIATMQRWLRDRGQPVPQPGTDGMAMMHGGHHDMQSGEMMPGMLTETQLKQLDAARGPEFDRLFLSFMIQHHSGAISMVNDLFSAYGAGQDESVFKIASDINVDQTTEVARMRRMLAARIFESGGR